MHGPINVKFLSVSGNESSVSPFVKSLGNSLHWLDNAVCVAGNKHDNTTSRMTMKRGRHKHSTWYRVWNGIQELQTINAGVVCGRWDLKLLRLGAGGAGGEGQILFQPCALSILGKVLCLCLFHVIGSFDAKHQHPTTVCLSVQNPAPAAKWRHLLKHPDVGLFLLPSSRNWRLYIKHIQNLFSYCSCRAMHTVRQHRPHCATEHCFTWNETQTMLLVGESIKLYTLETYYTRESAVYWATSRSGFYTNRNKYSKSKFSQNTTNVLSINL